RIYVAGGRPGALAVTEVYDPGTNAWTTLPPVPRPRSSIAGVAFDGHFLVLGGEDAAERTVYTEVDSFDPVSGRWSQLPPLPGGRQGLGAIATDNKVLVPGGGPTGGGGKQSDQLFELANS